MVSGAVVPEGGMAAAKARAARGLDGAGDIVDCSLPVGCDGWSEEGRGA